jgi:hypothetical protein
VKKVGGTDGLATRLTRDNVQLNGHFNAIEKLSSNRRAMDMRADQLQTWIGLLLGFRGLVKYGLFCSRPACRGTVFHSTVAVACLTRTDDGEFP